MDSAAPHPLRILHLVGSERWTGPAEPACSLAAGQRAQGHAVWLACTPGQSLERQSRQAGLPGVPGLLLNRRNPLSFFRDPVRIRRFCAEQSIDVVHCHLGHDHWLAALALGGESAAAKIVRTLHRSVAPREDRMHRWLYLKATSALICPGTALARSAEAALGLPPGRVVAVAGGVDLERFSPVFPGRPLRRRLEIPRGAPVAGLVARMRAGRGLRRLMRALPTVLERVPRAHFVVVGRGELKEWFKREIRDPRYRRQVHYAGYRTVDEASGPRRPDLPAAYAGMDATLFLGLGSEGSCRAILEAMASGRPTVGVAEGAVPEIIEDGETGLLVPPEDGDALVEALVFLLSDRGRCLAMGEAARRRAAALFSNAHRTEATLEVYRRVCAGPAAF